MHNIDCPFVIKRFGELIQILPDGFPFPQIEIGINGGKPVSLVRGSDIGWILLRRPGSLPVIHLFVVFWPEWGRGDKRIADQFISILEPVTFQMEVDDPFGRFLEKIWVTEIPVSGDKEDLTDRSSIDHPLKERNKEPVDKGFLIWEHIFIPFGWGEGRKEVST